MGRNHFQLVLLSLAHLVPLASAGCRWRSPAWTPTLDSAPQVEVSEERLVTVTWTEEQLEENSGCTDLFEVGVEHDGVERKVCSVKRQEGVVYSCKLDLSDAKHCAQNFGFWVAAVNFGSNRGPERIRSFANTLIQVRCDEGLEPAWLTQVKSSSCLAGTPTWESGPYIKQTARDQLRMTWDVRQLTLPSCILQFLLKFWPAAQFGLTPTSLKFQVGEQQQYGGSLAVEECSNYTWVLTALGQGGRARQTQGSVSVPCPGEPLMPPIGEIFLTAEVAGVSEGEESATGPGNVRGRAGTSQGGTDVSVTGPGGVQAGPGTSHGGAGLSDPVLAVELEANTQREGGRSFSMPPAEKALQTQSILRPAQLEGGLVETLGQGLPTLTASNSTRQSLSWSLEPAVGRERGSGAKVERVQISCWVGGARPDLDPPCCRTEIAQTEPRAATLVIEDLEPGTQYSCQGGVRVKGKWVFSPKSSRLTQPREGRGGGPALSRSSPLALVVALLVVLSGCVENFTNPM